MLTLAVLGFLTHKIDFSVQQHCTASIAFHKNFPCSSYVANCRLVCPARTQIFTILQILHCQVTCQNQDCIECVRRVPQKGVLRSLSLSYQKKDWRVGFFWYDTDITRQSVKAADYKSIVSVIPKEELVGPCLPILFRV